MAAKGIAIRIDRQSHLSLPQQISIGIIEEIRLGRLVPGQVLPGTRSFAKELGVHRNTLVASFEELIAQGWLETTPASHTRVAETLPMTKGTSRGPERRRAGFDIETWQNSARSFEAVDHPALDFTAGLPDPRLFPAELLARAYRRALRRSGSRLLDFGNPAGSDRLRNGIAKQLREERGVPARSEDLLLTRGSQFALHLLSLVLLKPGDTVAVESPGYPSAREAFQLVGASLLPIPVDQDGIVVETLERKLATAPVRALYLTPQFQDPTTVTLSASRRLALLALARKHRIAIIEADYDYEFCYEGNPALPMVSSDPHGHVIYVGTLTKAVAPGLRMGFVLGPPALNASMVALRGQIDRQGDHVLEHAVAELLEDGELARHSAKARREFLMRRDHLASLLQRHLGEALDFESPRGGLALWARAHASIDVEAWANAARKSGARVFTGRQYSPSRRSLPYLRLGFGHLDRGELEQGVQIMAKTLGPGP